MADLDLRSKEKQGFRKLLLASAIVVVTIVITLLIGMG
jgi:hypothetical protein